MSHPNDPQDPSLVNPLPFGPPYDYQGGIPEDLAELGYQLPRPSNQTDMPPGKGRFVLPPVATFQSIINLASRTYYSSFDQALQDNRQNTYVMRYDPTVMGALRDRQVPVVQLPWHIEADDESDPFQKMMADEMKRMVAATPNFQQFRRQLLEAIWYGKYGVQSTLGWDYSRGFKRLLVRDHAGVMGDKIVVTFGGRPGVLVHGAYQGPRVLTDMGLAHLFSPEEREQFVFHVFEPEDADIFQGQEAGQRFGYGVRGRIYWWWWQRNVVTQWMMDFLQTIGVGGLMIYYYEEDNEASLNAATAAASNQQSSQAILMPRRRNQTGGVDEVNKVDRIEASIAGSDLVYRVIVEYFNRVIRDYILMEQLSMQPGTGGAGVAMAGERKAADRQRYDAESLDETLTRQLVWVLQRYTWPSHPPERCPLKFVSNVDQPNPLEYMQAAQQFMGLGGTVAEEDARRILGFRKPKDGEPTLGGMQLMGAGTEEERMGIDNSQEGLMHETAQVQEGGFRQPWDRSEAARKGWETRRGGNPSSLPVQKLPFSRRGNRVRMSRREVTEQLCPECGTSPLMSNGKDMWCVNAPCEYYHIGKVRRQRYVPEREMGQRGATAETPIPVIDGGVKPYARKKVKHAREQGDGYNLQQPASHHVPDDLEGAPSTPPLQSDQLIPDVAPYGRRLTHGLNKEGPLILLKKKGDKSAQKVRNQHKDVAVAALEGEPTRQRNEASMEAMNKLDGTPQQHNLIDAAKRHVNETHELNESPIRNERNDTSALCPAVRDGDTLMLADGKPAPEFIRVGAIPKAWSDLMVARSKDAPVWLTANGGKKVVYNPSLAAGFARVREVMEQVKELSNDDLLSMAREGAVEPPFTSEDLLAAVATRLAVKGRGVSAEDVARMIGLTTDQVLSLVPPMAWN